MRNQFYADRQNELITQRHREILHQGALQIVASNKRSSLAALRSDSYRKRNNPRYTYRRFSTQRRKVKPTQRTQRKIFESYK